RSNWGSDRPAIPAMPACRKRRRSRQTFRRYSGHALVQRGYDTGASEKFQAGKVAGSSAFIASGMGEFNATLSGSWVEGPLPAKNRKCWVRFTQIQSGGDSKRQLEYPVTACYTVRAYRILGCPSACFFHDLVGRRRESC